MKTSKENLDDCTCVAPKGEFKPDKTHIDKIKKGCGIWVDFGRPYNEGDYLCNPRKLCLKCKEKLQQAELYEKKIDDAFGKLKDEIKARFRLLEVGDKSVIEEINKIREEMK